MVQAAHLAPGRGDLPALSRVSDRRIKNASFDWVAALAKFNQQFARTDYSWAQPNPRYLHLRLYLPSRRGLRVPPFLW